MALETVTTYHMVMKHDSLDALIAHRGIYYDDIESRLISTIKNDKEFECISVYRNLPVDEKGEPHLPYGSELIDWLDNRKSKITPRNFIKWCIESDIKNIPDEFIAYYEGREPVRADSGKSVVSIPSKVSKLASNDEPDVSVNTTLPAATATTPDRSKDIFRGLNDPPPVKKSSKSGCGDKDKTEDKAKSQTAMLMELAEGIPLFKDQNGAPYAFVKNECVPIENLTSYLTYLLSKDGTVASMPVVKNVVESLKSKAIHGSEKIHLFNRVAKLDQQFFYNMGEGRTVIMAPDGWKIDTAPCLFRRNANDLAQVDPVTPGDPWKLFDFVNVAEEHKLLFLVTIVSFLIPEIPHPIFHPYGSQGSGKTFLCTMVKSLIDPSSVGTFFKSNKLEEIVQQLNNNYVCMYDNFSSVSNDISDLFAVACTGGTFTKRKLYTDNEDVVFKLRNCVGVNGINLQIRRDDLMDRAVLLHLERISEDARREESELLKEFELVKPIILGGFLDAIVKAMNIYPDVKLDKMPRMADFYRWGYAIAEGLDGKGEQFIEDYRLNVELQKELLVEDNLLTQAIINKMDTVHEIWETTVGAAFKELKLIVNPDKSDPTFPRDSKTLARSLESVKATLNSEGITFIKGKRTADGYSLVFRKSAASPEMSPSNENSELDELDELENQIVQSFEFKPDMSASSQ
jgi:hypothetical protein